MKFFNDMRPESRVWIYQAERAFDAEVDLVSKILTDFVAQWQAHRQQLFASYEIVYNQFIIFAVDEEMASASGCSIDSSVRVIQEIEKKLNISLLNRMLLAYRKDKDIKVISRADFAKNYNTGDFTPDLIVFNNTIQYVKDLDKWEVPALESWHHDAFGNN